MSDKEIMLEGGSERGWLKKKRYGYKKLEQQAMSMQRIKDDDGSSHHQHQQQKTEDTMERMKKYSRTICQPIILYLAKKEKKGN